MTKPWQNQQKEFTIHFLNFIAIAFWTIFAKEFKKFFVGELDSRNITPLTVASATVGPPEPPKTSLIGKLTVHVKVA